MKDFSLLCLFNLVYAYINEYTCEDMELDEY